jgi:hypothetical protein
VSKVEDYSEMRYVDAVPTEETFVVGDTAHEPTTSSRFNVTNEQAVPVTERATSSYSAKNFTIGADPVMMIGRRRGRRTIAISCPGTVTKAGTGTTPKGFMFSFGRNDLDTGIGFQVNPGDSVTIDSEAEIWVAPLPGNTTGVVQYLETFDALAGPAAR